MTWSKRKKAQDQRRQRRQKNERTFLFTVEGHLLRDIERIPWERVVWRTFPHSNGFSGSPRGLGCGVQLTP
jgi:hypothetical protein